MKQFTMVSLSTVKVEYWRLHKAGCKDLGKEQGTFETYTAKDAKSAVAAWIDGELEDMGYSTGDVKVLPCSNERDPEPEKPVSKRHILTAEERSRGGKAAAAKAAGPTLGEWTTVRDTAHGTVTYKAELSQPVEGRYGPANAVEVWYDRSQRLWTSFLVDGHGYQMGPAQYDTTREDAQRFAASLAR